MCIIGLDTGEEAIHYDLQDHTLKDEGALRKLNIHCNFIPIVYG